MDGVYDEAAIGGAPVSAGAAALRRWRDSGGTWRVLARHGDTVTVALLTCDAGEEVDRITATDPLLVRLLDEFDDEQRGGS